MTIKKILDKAYVSRYNLYGPIFAVNSLEAEVNENDSLEELVKETADLMQNSDIINDGHKKYGSPSWYAFGASRIPYNNSLSDESQKVGGFVIVSDSGCYVYEGVYSLIKRGKILKVRLCDFDFGKHYFRHNLVSLQDGVLAYSHQNEHRTDLIKVNLLEERNRGEE